MTEAESFSPSVILHTILSFAFLCVLYFFHTSASRTLCILCLLGIEFFKPSEERLILGVKLFPTWVPFSDSNDKNGGGTFSDFVLEVVLHCYTGSTFSFLPKCRGVGRLIHRTISAYTDST